MQIDRRCGIWDYLELYEDIGLYELIVIVVFGSIVLPFYRVSLYGLMQIMFYEGIGVSWYSRNDVNYQTSCEESELLPWMREDVKASFKSLPGRMKIATMMASTLENLMRFAFVQTCVNAFAITIFTTQTSENDETVSLNLRPEIMWGYVSVSLFSIVSAASVLVVRWEMNRWIRWYKRKTVVAGEASSRSVEPFDSTEGSHIEVAVVEDSITSLMEPLIQSEPLTVAEEVGNRNEDRQVESICSVQQILWYLAAAGCIVSWIAVVSGIDIFKLEYKSIPVPGEEYHWSRYSSVYDFTQDQYLYTYESPFAFRTIQFIAITVICFLIPSAIMMLCFVIEMRRDHLNNLWTRTLVCALQYFRFYNGGESILASFFVMYYEATRVMEGLVKIDIAGENFYLTAKFVLVPGTWFFMTFYVSKHSFCIFQDGYELVRMSFPYAALTQS